MKAEELRFKAQQGEVYLTAQFVEPLFTAFRNAEDLHRALFAMTGPLGGRWGEATWEGSSLGDQGLHWPAWDRATSLRLRREHVQLNCWNLDKWNSFWELTTVALQTPWADQLSSFKTYELSWSAHGNLDNGSVADIVARFSGPAPALGPVRASGVVFYYGEEPPQLSSALTIDISTSVTDGLYLKSLVTWDATKIEPSALPGAATAQVVKVFERIGLTRV